MRRAPFVGYKIPAPASAHCAMQPERSRYASASFKPFGERGGRQGRGRVRRMARDRAEMRAVGNLERDPRIGAAWDKRHLPTKTLLAYRQAHFSPSRNDSRMQAHNVPAWEKHPCAESPPLPSRGDGRARARNVLARERRRVRPGAILPSGDDGQTHVHNVPAWEKHPTCSEPISPKTGRCSNSGAHCLGLGETPAFLPEKQANRAQRPCSGEIGWRKIPAWEGRREGPTPLPGETSRPSPARTGEFLPSRDVAQKSGRFRAPAAKTLPSRDDEPFLRRNVLAWEKPRMRTGPISPKTGRCSNSGAHCLGLGETPAFLPGIGAIPAQRPCSGETPDPDRPRLSQGGTMVSHNLHIVPAWERNQRSTRPPLPRLVDGQP